MKMDKHLTPPEEPPKTVFRANEKDCRVVHTIEPHASIFRDPPNITCVGPKLDKH